MRNLQDTSSNQCHANHELVDDGMESITVCSMGNRSSNNYCKTTIDLVLVLLLFFFKVFC